MGAESESWPGMVTSQSRSVTCLGMEVRQRSKDLHHCYSFCRAQLGKCTECRNSWYSQASCTWQLLKLLSHLRTGGAKIPSNSASILGWGHRPLLYWLQKGKINLVLGLFSIRKKKKDQRWTQYPSEIWRNSQGKDDFSTWLHRAEPGPVSGDHGKMTHVWKIDSSVVQNGVECFVRRQVPHLRCPDMEWFTNCSV